MRSKLYNVLLGLNRTCMRIGKERSSPIPKINIRNDQTVDELIGEICRVERHLRFPEYWYMIKASKNV